MPVIDITKDATARTLTLTAHFAAPVERLWRLYADPRQLERVWGPPTHPATFVDHELTPGTRSTYFMTGPDGEKFAGLWNITATDEPNGFCFEDGFAHEDFTPVEGLPLSRSEIRFTTSDSGGTDMVVTTTYDSAEALQQVLDMGMEEGTTQATNQIDAFLAEHP